MERPWRSVATGDIRIGQCEVDRGKACPCFRGIAPQGFDVSRAGRVALSPPVLAEDPSAQPGVNEDRFEFRAASICSSQSPVTLGWNSLCANMLRASITGEAIAHLERLHRNRHRHSFVPQRHVVRGEVDEGGL